MSTDDIQFHPWPDGRAAELESAEHIREACITLLCNRAERLHAVLDPLEVDALVAVLQHIQRREIPGEVGG